jgi:hypothetical protein
LCAKRVFVIEPFVLSLRVLFCHYLLNVEVKSIGVPMKGDHIEGLCQLFLERATAVENKWVACFIQEYVIANVL